MSESLFPPKLATLGELLFEGGGEFNHLTWQVHPTLSENSDSDALASLHEWSHHELNNVTSYGLLLTYFAFLARHADQSRQAFADRLLQLVAACHVAHEVYATWFSVELLAARFPKATLLSKLPPDYRAFHQQGETIVAGIESPFIRQQTFLTAVRSCFESQAFSEFDCARADQFRLADIRARDLPDARLDFIANSIPPGLFLTWTRDYCERSPDAKVIRTALEKSRDQDFFDLPLPEADAALARFLRWLAGKWRVWLAERILVTGDYECHLAMVPALVDDMNRRCSNAAVVHPLRATTSPHDTAAVLLQQMENEMVRLRREPLPADFIPLGELPRSVWPSMPVGKPPHLFIQARSLDDISRQHGTVPSMADVKRNVGLDPLVFLRRRTPLGQPGEEMINLLYFRDPQELKDFRAATVEIQAYGLVSSALEVDQAWRDAWLDPSILWVSKIDHSLSAFLMQHCQSQEQVRYSTATLRDEARIVHFVTFLTRRAGESHWGLYIGFCGEQTAKACVQFINQKLDPAQVVFDRQPFEGDLAPALSVIATHMMRDECFFNFNQLVYS